MKQHQIIHHKVLMLRRQSDIAGSSVNQDIGNFVKISLLFSGTQISYIISP